MKPALLSVIIYLLCSISIISLDAQVAPKFEPIIGQIGELESQRDPKCHATASRLEDFIYGTPLSFEARNKRIEFQKSYVKTIWVEYTKALNTRSAG